MSRVNILIIDDETKLRDLLGRIILREGYRVVEGFHFDTGAFHFDMIFPFKSLTGFRGGFNETQYSGWFRRIEAFPAKRAWHWLIHCKRFISF